MQPGATASESHYNVNMVRFLVVLLLGLGWVSSSIAQSKPQTHYLVIFASISAKNWEQGLHKAEAMTAKLRKAGLKAQIYDTYDYSNLRDGYFAIGVPYKTKAEALKNLPSAKRRAKDAYVKWAGHFEACGC